jgi:hypothetical protein
MPGEPSKIINRAELEEQQRVEQARDYEILRKKNIEEGGEDPGPMQQPSTSGIANRRVGFNRESATAPSGAPRESFAETDARKRSESAASGAFGARAQAKAENLQGRQSLFAEMRKPVTEEVFNGDPGAQEQGYRDRAKSLGIDDVSFARGLARSQDKEFAEPTAASESAAPLQGRALAEKNIAAMGVQGAAADYFKRAGAEKAARPAAVAATPAAAPTTFASSFAAERDTDEPSPAMRQAKANAVSSRWNANTMRAEYERSRTPEPAAPAPAASPTPPTPTPTSESAPAPASIGAALGADIQGVDRALRGATSAGLMATARGGQAVAEGAGNLLGANLRMLARGYTEAGEAKKNVKRKAASLIPGRTGEYIRNR